METARCRAFLAAAETGSFSRAAEMLRYTPSGVNQLVTALEKEIGFSLFSRSTKGVALTANGQLLLPVIREILHQEDKLFELSAQMNGLLIGTVTIAAYSSIATHWLPAVIRDFQENYPHVEIKLMEGIWQEVSQWLEERTRRYRLPKLPGEYALRVDPTGRGPHAGPAAPESSSGRCRLLPAEAVRAGQLHHARPGL